MSGEAFEDLLVLDLSQGIAGPYCAKWFADFGATVVKIEPPGLGDAARAAGPFPGDLPDPEKSGLFLYLNGRKRSVTLNLDREPGPSILRRLAVEADLLVEDAPPGTMARRGLGFEDLSAAHPGLIYLAISSFGQSGPYRDYPATELTLAAFSGTMTNRASGDREPLKMGGSQSLYIAGRCAFIAAMGALLLRDATGQGQFLDASCHESAAINDMAAPTTYSYQGLARQPRRPPAARGRGGLGDYPCKDGTVNVLPGVGGLKKLAALLGDPSLAEHPWFRDHQLRGEHAGEFDVQFMDPWFGEHTREEIVERAQDLGMPFSYAITTGEVMRDPQLRARDFFASIDHPATGPLPYPTAPLRGSAGPPRAGRAPLLGEHNEEILCGRLGHTREELRRLRELGVV